MTRTEYMQQLHRRLCRLPQEEYQSAMQYYNEYFNDAGEENEQRVIAELGNPQQVAAQILSDYAMKGVAKAPASAKKGLSALWVVILSIFALPIGLPLAFAGVVTSLALVLSVLIIYLVLFLSGAVVMAAGFCMILGGIAVVLQGPMTTLFFIGAGLIGMGVGLLILMFMTALWKKTFGLLAKFYYRHVRRERWNKK